MDLVVTYRHSISANWYQIVQSPVFIHRQIDPAGQYFGYKAAAAGTKDQEVQLL